MMKYLLVLAVVLVGFYVWRHNRRAEAREAQEEADAAARRQKPAQQRPPTLPHRMLTCRHCGLHLPASEAVKGTLGPYCGAEHRRLAEGE
jgi:uncharacterized protein